MSGRISRWLLSVLFVASAIACHKEVVDPSVPYSCSRDEECGPGYFCEAVASQSYAGVCRVVGYCTGDNRCLTTGLACREGRCVEIACGYVGDCTGNEVCGPRDVAGLGEDGMGLGLLIGNLVKLPDWLRAGAQSEFYVKTGLVLLGSTILFGDILSAGSFGLIQAVIVVIAVWYFTFWIARKMKVDDEFSTMLASGVSICGVSAAIATAGAINGDKKKLSFIISIVLIVAIPMMVLMPALAKWMGLSDMVTGAWMGGTIDTTGAVVAAGTIAGETGLKYATIVDRKSVV